jgi:hypothetical protein
MASRFSYVTTDLPGNGELVEHSKARLCVHPNDSKSLLGSFQTLTSTAKHLQEAAYQRVVPLYNEETELRERGNLLTFLGSITTAIL